MNPFEAGTRKVIPAVLIYVRAGRHILMLHRDRGTHADGTPDYHSGKWNGLGGKLELDESPLQGARRELHEEAGLELHDSAFHCLGTLQFPNFKAHRNEDWVVWVFAADAPAEALSRKLAGPEGSLHWIPQSDLLELNLWAGDRHFIPHVLSRTPFIGTIWYDGQSVTRWWVEPTIG